MTHAFMYGTAVFEGIRAYETDEGPAVFRLTDHMKRLENSARIMMMELPYSVDELIEAVKLTVRSTGLWPLLSRRVEAADLVLIATDGDNTNVVIGQVLQKRYGIGTVVVRVLDPARATFYAERGLNTVCPTKTAITVLIDTVRATAPATAEAQA